MGNGSSDFIKSEILRSERNIFIFKLLSIVILYTIITLWLNSIRATALIWFVWFLIILQFAFYFSIFIISYNYSKVCGLNKNIGLILFIVITLLGRINDWQLIIIPLIIVFMLIFAIKNKNLSKKGRTMLSNTTVS